MAIWLSEADVTSLLDLPGAIAALRRGLLAEAQGGAANMLKTHVTWSAGNTLHAIGAALPQENLVGTKTWAHTQSGASPLLILFDSNDGSLQAIIEAFRLGQMRTGGISAIATDHCAAADAGVMAIIGTGKQALSQVEAVAQVRALRRICVFSPNPAHRAAFSAKLAAIVAAEVVDCQGLEQALAHAQIVTLATRARQPFLRAAMLHPGTHINAIGAITPERQEFAPDVLDRCSCVAADSPAATQALSAEFRAYFAADAWAKVIPLCRLVENGATRPSGADLTLFKAMGTGLADVAIGLEVLRRARAAGRGTRIPTE